MSRNHCLIPEEQLLKFPPTYRVVVGKDDVYDTVKKKTGKVITTKEFKINGDFCYLYNKYFVIC